MVIGATNRPHVLDGALRRAGRFDRELALGVPNLGARQKILEVLYEKLRIDGQFDFEQVARLTPGYVGADLAALTKESAVMAIHRIFLSVNEKSPLSSIPPLNDAAPVSTDEMDQDAPETHTVPTPASLAEETGTVANRNVVR